MANKIDIFAFHSKVMERYKSFSSSFVDIDDRQIEEALKNEGHSKILWPDPLIQFNPFYEQGASTKNLVDSKSLHPEMLHVFKDFNLHKHQEEALELGIKNKGFIVTSGTGSGKSLTFLGTIFNYVFSELGKGESPKGVIGLIVYPMNALINSQSGEIKKLAENYKKSANKEFPISFGQFTGQEDEDTREKMRTNPPHIILTNYMMLELILTRGRDKNLRSAMFDNLKYLAFDELHTFRGRQGADVAMLIRRIKAECKNELVCIGTSATMAGGKTAADRKQKVSNVASNFFGSSFTENQVIEESLRAISAHHEEPSSLDLSSSLEKISTIKTPDELIAHPLFRWLEKNIALKKEGDNYQRGKPKTVQDIAKELCLFINKEKDCDRNNELYEKALLSLFDTIATVNNYIQTQNIEQKLREPFILPFKFHQFIAQSATIAVSLHRDKNRIIDFEGLFSKKIGDEDYPLYPIVFNRTSGKPFLCVRKNYLNNVLEARDFNDTLVEVDDEEQVDNSSIGYIIPEADIWNPSEDIYNLPPQYVEERKGVFGLKKNHEKRFPSLIYYNDLGEFTENEYYAKAGWHKGCFLPLGYIYDPTSGDMWTWQTSEFRKLSRLGLEGRSSSTTILSLSILEAMEELGFSESDRKILSFSDNRQDSSLQSGHFNDFVSTVRFRSALVKALDKKDKINFEEIDSFVFEELDLKVEDYGNVPEGAILLAPRKFDIENAFKKFIKYQLSLDIGNAWRINLPGLESCGLIKITYKDWDAIIEDPVWSNIKERCEKARADYKEIIFNIVENFRKHLALDHNSYFTQTEIKNSYESFRQFLKPDWQPEENEIKSPTWMCLDKVNIPFGQGNGQSIGPASRLGIYIKNQLAPAYEDNKMSNKDYYEFMGEILLILNGNYFASREFKTKGGEKKLAYRLMADLLVWEKGDGFVPNDPVFRPQITTKNKEPNKFFKQLYQTANFSVRTKSKEHTGQVDKDLRKELENSFREGKLSTLFCSPTMELGIDIADLSVVHMRNVPPNPANYAQRSGRAGRSGQPALVFTNCSRQSPHDIHYFEDREGMVSGIVQAPRLDLKNEDLLYSHFNSLYLTTLGIQGIEDGSFEFVIDTANPDLPVKPDIKALFEINKKSKSNLIKKWNVVIKDLKDELENKSWYSENWAENKFNDVFSNFEASLNRWRSLYRQHLKQKEVASKITNNDAFSTSSKEYKEASRNIALADKLRDQLLNKSRGLSFSEFYTFRYLASEGFLPGYNFTRLPVRLLIERGDFTETISRDRVLAIREMGPENILYHSGSKYKVARAQIQDLANELNQATVCKESGYVLFGEEQNKNNDPWSGIALEGNQEVLKDLLFLPDGIAERREHISCEEEERQRLGYKINTWFRYNGNVSALEEIRLMGGDDILLKMRYIPAADLVYVNEGWLANKQQEGFVINKISGHWKSHTYRENLLSGKLKNTKVKKENLAVVKIYTTDTADALYIEPLKVLELSYDGRVTLQYALKTAVERVFQVESSELGITPIGNPESPNLLMYEASEGSLGVMAALVREKNMWQKVIEEAWKLCRFDEEEYQDRASYKDLLSYYNQMDHPVIDRFLIKDTLKRLGDARVEVGRSDAGTYEEQYQFLLDRYDVSSATEKKFLDYLYKNGLRLPDDAQQTVQGVYVKSDFYYAPKQGANGVGTYIFCDGTPHNREEIASRDIKQRQAILDTGQDYIVYRYDDSLDELVAKYPSIFRKVR